MPPESGQRVIRAKGVFKGVFCWFFPRAERLKNDQKGRKMQKGVENPCKSA